MWRGRLSAQLQTLARSRSASNLTRFVTGDINRSFISPSPAPFRRTASLFSRLFSTESADNAVSKEKKTVEDVMPIATGHEREELEAALEVIFFLCYCFFLILDFFYLFGCDGEMIVVLIGLFH
ncbi:hypothetical protein PVL29_011549 [Vitis rotundifolia]|uniref:Uncharacterized protein n=1 Tax=Vitis rotundifolia TaxID=103349 RepID=A0AA38ZP35_VITRO|nr:hypothetical protein PVL29_011549 [Vitis rotundifolia]